jgi:hypothetical protein
LGTDTTPIESRPLGDFGGRERIAHKIMKQLREQPLVY